MGETELSRHLNIDYRNEEGFQVMDFQTPLLNLYHRVQLEKELEAFCARNNPAIISLRNVESVDSAILALFLHAHVTQKKKERSLFFIEVSNDVRAILELTRLNFLIPIHDSIRQVREILSREAEEGK